MNLYSDIEEQVTEKLESAFGSKCRVVASPTDYRLEQIAEWVTDHVTRQPHVLTYTYSADEVELDTTYQIPTDDIEVRMYVVAKSTAADADVRARRIAETWCLNTRAVLQGEQFSASAPDGTPYTSEAPMGQYSVNQYVVAGGFAIYEVRMILPLAIDLDTIKENI